MLLFIIDSLGMLSPTDVTQFEKGDLKFAGNKALTALVRNMVNHDCTIRRTSCTNHYAPQDMFDQMIRFMVAYMQVVLLLQCVS